MSPQDRNFLKLLMRSPDRGDGWRQCTPATWSLVDMFGHPELLEKDIETHKVRLSVEGIRVIAAIEDYGL